MHLKTPGVSDKTTTAPERDMNKAKMDQNSTMAKKYILAQEVPVDHLLIPFG